MSSDETLIPEPKPRKFSFLFFAGGTIDTIGETLPTIVSLF
jgi:hypothetical protein